MQETKPFILKKITLEELRSPVVTSPPTVISDKPGKKIVTQNGYMVNYHNTFFFADAAINKRHPWKATISSGTLPCNQEWCRLQKEHGLMVEILTKEENEKAAVLAEMVRRDPMEYLTKDEIAGYLRRRGIPFVVEKLKRV